MKVIKCINNNVAICLDSSGNEVVVFGKGVGFKKPPYDLELRQIDRTYYDIDDIYISMINDINPEVIDIADAVVNYARLLIDNPISSNILFTLADHIDFSIKRYEQNMGIKLPIDEDIKYLFEVEMDIGRYAVNLIRKKLKVYIPDEEATYIALHIISSQSKADHKREKLDEKIIEDSIKIIEKHFNISVKMFGFNYSRFVSHMHYLLKRGKKNEMIQSENNLLYESLKKSFPKTYICSQEIREYLNVSMKWELTDEESIYLMLHINRLCAAEDCNQ